MPSKQKLAPVVGRDGISVARDQESSTVELDTTFGRLLGLNEGQKVCSFQLFFFLNFLTSYQIGLFVHLDPPVAHTINIEPLTPEDWESMFVPHNLPDLHLRSCSLTISSPSYRTPCEFSGAQSPVADSCSTKSHI